MGKTLAERLRDCAQGVSLGADGMGWSPDPALLDEAADKIVSLHAELQYARDGLTKGRSRMREDNERLAREAHTWSKAAETYATELERHKPLLQAVEWLLDDGHMNTEHLARLRAAWEAALGPNASMSGPQRPAQEVEDGTE
jgi:hypothetical protein